MQDPSNPPFPTYLSAEEHCSAKKDSATTIADLFLASFVGDYEDDAAWDAVAELRRRNTLDVFDLAASYCRSETFLHRARGLDVLGQLGAGKPLAERPFFDQCVSIAIGHLRDEEACVVHSAAWALAHLGGDASVTALIEVKRHTDADVRWAVAYGMSGHRIEAVSTLIELMEDKSDDVRNWATFGIGRMRAGGDDGSLDSPEIQAALRDHLTDSFVDVRSEAIWGLALRKDPDCLQLLLNRLDAEEWAGGDEMCAVEVLDVRCDTPVDELCEGLRKLLEAMHSESPLQ